MKISEVLLVVGWAMGCQLPFLAGWMHRCILPAPGNGKNVRDSGGTLLALEFAEDAQRVGEILWDKEGGPADPERVGMRDGLVAAVQIDFFFIISYGLFLALFASAMGLCSHGMAKATWFAAAVTSTAAGVSDVLEN